MKYSVKLKPQAEKQLKKLDKKQAERITIAIAALAFNPRPAASLKMSGYDDVYRLRVGDYRILYEIHDSVLLIQVVRVGHRKDVYKSK